MYGYNITAKVNRKYLLSKSNQKKVSYTLTKTLIVNECVNTYPYGFLKVKKSLNTYIFWLKVW